MKRRPAALLAVLLLAASCQSPVDALAARATFDAIAPEYSAYVNADTNLTAEQKDRRARSVQAWEIWVKELEVKR